MNELIKKYEELNEKKKIIEQELNDIKNEIKTEMRINDKDYDVINGVEVSYITVKRKILDKKELKKYIKENDLKECYKETEYKRLTIKKVEQ